MPPKKKAAKKSSNGATVGYEAELWQMADALRGSMDAAEYKHVVLGLIFLKYISDAFEEKHAQLVAEKAGGADPEDPDEYRAVNIFWVPPEARWPHLKGQAKQPTIGQIVDDAMAGIERDNPSLKGVLPKDYARPALDKRRLGQLVDLVSNIDFSQPSPQTPLPKGEGLSASRRTSAISEGEGLSASRCTSTISDGEGLSASRRTSAVSVDRGRHAHDLLGRVYEYFLSQFASAEGKKGGEFYTPRCVVRLLVEMIEPYKGRVYDPCCGSSGMFVQSEEFITAHGGRVGDISIYGQESNYTTWRLAKMNLAIRGVDAQIAHGDTFHNDRHPDLKADFILANPPFNISDWGGDRLRDDKRWQFGAPPTGNANFAWVQHMVHHLAPKGIAGFVLANGSMSSNQSGEGDIRRNLVEAGLVDCMVALPGQLFYSTQIPACLWFLRRGKPSPLSPLPKGEGNSSIERKRNTNPSPIGRGAVGEGSVLFIDARKLGSMVDRTHRELTAEDIQKIADTYHAWRAQGLTPAKQSGDGSVPALQGEDALKQGQSRAALGTVPDAYEDIPGFCKSASLDEIRKHGHVLTPGRYVGAEEVEDDGEPFEEKMSRLTAQLHEQQTEAKRLDEQIRKNLKELGFGG